MSISNDPTGTIHDKTQNPSGVFLLTDDNSRKNFFA